MMETRTGSLSRLPSSSEILSAIAIALGAVAFLLRNDPGGLSFDPDSYMHLARFREGYGIFHGGFVARDNAPYGTVLPWTMPMDGALALFYALGRLFAGPDAALYFAARVVSPFFCATIGPIMFFGLRPFFSVRARFVIGGLAATAPQLVAFSVPGDADHHAMIVWLSVLFAVALIRHLFADPPRFRDAAATGIAAAVALWASAEAFIVIGTGLSALVLHRCLVEPAPARGARARDLVLCGVLAIALTAAWLVDRPYGGLWAPDVDRLSIVYVSFAWLFAAVLLGLDAYASGRAPFSPSRNLAAAVLLGGIAFACWVAFAPDILGGPFGQVDRALRGVFFTGHDLEMLPLWRLTVWTVPHMACLVVVAMAFAVVIAKSSGRERWIWIAAAGLLIPVSLVGVRYVRAIYYAEVFGSIPLGLVLAWRTRQYAKYSRFMEYSAVAASAAAMLGVYAVALGIYIGTVSLWTRLNPSHQPRSAVAAAPCGPKDLAEVIAPIEDTDAIVMTEINYAPRVLYLSPRLRTVAGPFHRNTEGITDVYAFFGARGDDQARAILDKRGIKYVLICDTGQSDTYEVFKDRILHDTPAWLEPVGASAPQSSFRLYRVRSAG